MTGSTSAITSRKSRDAASGPRGHVIGEHWHERHPWADVAGVLFRHHSRGLRDMSEVVYHPRRQQLPQRDGAQTGMFPEKIELAIGELPGAEQREVIRTQAR